MTRLKRFGRPERKTPGRRRRRSTKPKAHHAWGKKPPPETVLIKIEPPLEGEPIIVSRYAPISRWDRLCRWIRGLMKKKPRCPECGGTSIIGRKALWCSDCCYAWKA